MTEAKRTRVMILQLHFLTCLKYKNKSIFTIVCYKNNVKITFKNIYI